MADDIIVELLNRIISLEKRVDSLEQSINKSQIISDHPGKAANRILENVEHTKEIEKTRDKALRFLKYKLPDNITISGYGNRGRNRLRLKSSTGDEEFVYLATSRNYSESEGMFAGWHTISPDDITNQKYNLFILSVEDSSSKPLFFIFSKSDMEKFVSTKKPDSKPYYHFYLTKDNEGNFIDQARDSSSVSQPVDRFLDNWEAFRLLS